MIKRDESIDNRPNFMFGKRGQGKTALLIKQAYETEGTIVCSSHRTVNYILCMARELGYSIRKPITYGGFFVHAKGKRNMSYYFDDYEAELKLAILQAIHGFECNNVRTIMLDKGFIESLNDVFGSLKISDLDGNKLRLKIEVFEEDKNRD